MSSKETEDLSSAITAKCTNQTESSVITPELVSLLCEGSEDAFRTIYLHFYRSIEGFLFSLLRSKEESEDMAQDIFMSIWNKRSQIDPEKNIRSFIYRIAMNSVINSMNHRKVSQKYTDIAKKADNYNEVTSEDLFIAQETELLIELTVSKMPKIRRMVFELSHYEKLDNSAIADKLSISKANVANHLVQARRDIKKVLTMICILLTV